MIPLSLRVYTVLKGSIDLILTRLYFLSLIEIENSLPPKGLGASHSQKEFVIPLNNTGNYANGSEDNLNDNKNIGNKLKLNNKRGYSPTVKSKQRISIIGMIL